MTARRRNRPARVTGERVIGMMTRGSAGVDKLDDPRAASTRSRPAGMIFRPAEAETTEGQPDQGADPVPDGQYPGFTCASRRCGNPGDRGQLVYQAWLRICWPH